MMAKHTYPSNYTPGPDQHWAINRSWEVMDILPPGTIPDDARFLLAGAITAALIEANRYAPKKEN